MCLLKKSLYGFKQLPKPWYKRFNSFMTHNGYSIYHFDSCVYYKRQEDDSFVNFLLYANDVLILARHTSEINGLKSLIGGEFDMKDLSGAKKI